MMALSFCREQIRRILSRFDNYVELLRGSLRSEMASCPAVGGELLSNSLDIDVELANPLPEALEQGLTPHVR